MVDRNGILIFESIDEFIKEIDKRRGKYNIASRSFLQWPVKGTIYVVPCDNINILPCKQASWLVESAYVKSLGLFWSEESAIEYAVLQAYYKTLEKTVESLQQRLNTALCY